ncbi:transporter substrate-binding domain-containing protein [Azohydromonas aeria]|uniref:transporter substrate-binding domain-containing protein n=1 Tax=Azohydromonas aeria TaxID=2590212 RepID=UPI0012FC638A|nr:transporter substrate-binding domain-containing protein [Azohydromonas aeria]
MATAALAMAPAAMADSIADKVKQAGVVRIGTGNDTPPMNFIDDKGRWTGFDVELGDEIAKRLGVKVERVAVNNKTRIAFLANGQIDMAISNISRTLGREEQVDFVDPPYLWTSKVFYAKKGKFKSLADLAGKRIGVNQGSNAFTAAPAELAKHSKAAPQMVAFQKNAEVFLALKQGKIDAFTQDSPIIAAVAGEEGTDYEAVGGGYSPGLYSVGVPQNDSKWRLKVSMALQSMLKDGSYEQLYQSWFGPKGKYPLPLNARPRLPAEVFGENAPMVWPE